jgi:hypothetical protein
MSIHIDIHQLLPVLAIAAGIGVLAFPRLMRYIVGIYLIALGLIQLIQ